MAETSDILLTAAATGTTGAWIALPSHASVSKDHLRTIYVSGTFAGGTAVTFEATIDEVTAFAIEDSSGPISVTAKKAFNIEIRATAIRAIVSSGAADSINAKIR